MTENIEEKLAQMKDVEAPEMKSEEPGLELAKGEENDAIVKNLDKIATAVEGDQAVTRGDVDDLREALQNMEVDFGGDSVPLEQLKNDSDMLNNIKVWHEIRDKNLRGADLWLRYRQLTRITPKILETIIDREPKGVLYLDNLKDLSDESAEVFRRKDFIGSIGLPSVKNISDQALDALTANGKNSLDLTSLKSLSDRQAIVLIRLKGHVPEGESKIIESKIFFRDLKDVSEKGLQALAKIERISLELPKEIEDKVDKRRSKFLKLIHWIDNELKKLRHYR
ncbi:MAG: hypothetical protein WC663_04885 [Patescibacteria group bacterium]|jgi:hypothetical protein